MNLVVAAGGAAWESRALDAIERIADLQLARRCVDVADLLAAAAAELGTIALVSARLPGLDLDVVDRLRRSGMHVVAARDGDEAEAARLGLDTVAVDDLATLRDLGPVEAERSDPEAPLIAVWGPTGAPGRSSVATSIAAALAARTIDTVLIDADVEGGAQAQSLGLLDDVSGLISAVRAANQGRAETAASNALPIEPHLRLITGLPRADMAAQLRPAPYAAVIEAVRRACRVAVVDCGFSVDTDRGGRGATTVATLERADAIVVVGRVDPLGLSRLVRCLHDLGTIAPGRSPHVLLNHARRSLGWSDREVDATVARLSGVTPRLHLPWDQPGWDAAVMTGRTLRAAAPSSPFVARIEAFAADLARALLPGGTFVRSTAEERDATAESTRRDVPEPGQSHDAASGRVAGDPRG